MVEAFPNCGRLWPSRIDTVRIAVPIGHVAAAAFIEVHSLGPAWINPGHAYVTMDGWCYFEVSTKRFTGDRPVPAADFLAQLGRIYRHLRDHDLLDRKLLVESSARLQRVDVMFDLEDQATAGLVIPALERTPLADKRHKNDGWEGDTSFKRGVRDWAAKSYDKGLQQQETSGRLIRLEMLIRRPTLSQLTKRGIDLDDPQDINQDSTARAFHTVMTRAGLGPILPTFETVRQAIGESGLPSHQRNKLAIVHSLFGDGDDPRARLGQGAFYRSRAAAMEVGIWNLIRAARSPIESDVHIDLTGNRVRAVSTDEVLSASCPWCLDADCG